MVGPQLAAAFSRRTIASRAAFSAALSADEARDTAVREGLKLTPADNKTGFSCVYFNGSKYAARVRVRGLFVFLGEFVTAEEAALHVARHKAKAEAEAAAAAGRGSS